MNPRCLCEIKYLFCGVLLSDHGDAARDAIGEQESLFEVGGFRPARILLLYDLHDEVLVFAAGVFAAGAGCDRVQSVFCQEFYGGNLSCLLILRSHLSIYHY